MKNRNIIKNILLSILSGILLVLSFPPYNLFFLAFIAFIPLYYVIYNKDTYHKFVYGCITGLFFYTGLIYWIYHVTIAVFLLIIYLSIFMGLWTYLITLLYNEKNSVFLNINIPAFIFIIISLITGKGSLGFPWGNLGYSQYSNIFFIQIIDITGINFLTLIILSTNYVLYKTIMQKQHKIIKIFQHLFILLLVFAGIYIYGFIRFNHVKTRLIDGPVYGLCQGNIDQDKKWDKEYREHIWNQYIDLTYKSIEKNADIILWPESASPYNLKYNKKYLNQLLNISKNYNITLIIGSSIYKYRYHTIGGYYYDIYNSALYITPWHGLKKIYSKFQLVPFGEYVPFKNLLPFVKKIVYSKGGGDFIRGKKYTLFDYPKGNIGPTICYESLFPEIARNITYKSAKMLVNLTNDAWYKKTSAPYQHFAFCRFRAIENRRPFIRVANTGISGIIQPTGIIENKTDIYIKKALVEKAKLFDEKSIYTILGGWFDGLIIGLTIITLLLIYYSQDKRKKIYKEL